MEGLRGWNQNVHWEGDEFNFGWNFLFHKINLDLQATLHVEPNLAVICLMSIGYYYLITRNDCCICERTANTESTDTGDQNLHFEILFLSWAITSDENLSQQ